MAQHHLNWVFFLWQKIDTPSNMYKDKIIQIQVCYIDPGNGSEQQQIWGLGESGILYQTKQFPTGEIDPFDGGHICETRWSKVLDNPELEKPTDSEVER